MVAVTSQEALAEGALPVSLVPEPPGKWRWVGTKTLLFEPAVRFPMATTYTVETVAGLRSATGGVLAAPMRWTFTTPPPRLTSSYPKDEPARRETLVFAAFDQKVDPQAVLATTVVRAAQGVVRARLATAEEVKADDAVRARAATAGDGRWVALRAVDPLPADSRSRSRSVPGRRPPKAAAHGQGAGLELPDLRPPARHGPRVWMAQGECPPFTPWQITFSNPIDPEAFRKEMVRVEPNCPR